MVRMAALIDLLCLWQSLLDCGSYWKSQRPPGTIQAVMNQCRSEKVESKLLKYHRCYYLFIASTSPQIVFSAHVIGSHLCVCSDTVHKIKACYGALYVCCFSLSCVIIY